MSKSKSLFNSNLNWYPSFILFLLFSICSNAQQKNNQNELAYQEFVRLKDSMEMMLDEEDIFIFDRTNFTNKQLQDYLSWHFKRIDLLDNIEGHHAERLQFYYFAEDFFKRIGFKKQARKSYLDFIKFYAIYKNELSPLEDSELKKMRPTVYNSLANNYVKESKLDSARYMLKENIRLTSLDNTIYYPSLLNNYGLHLYFVEKKRDSANYYFQKAFKNTKSNFPDHTLVGSIRDNIADLYVDIEKYAKALQLYLENFKFYQVAINENIKSKDVSRLVSAGAQAVETSVAMGNLSNATTYFEDLKELISDSEYKKDLNVSANLEFLRVKELLEFKKGNLGKAYASAKKISAIKDSLNVKDAISEELWRKELSDINNERAELAYKIKDIQLENEIRKQRSRLWISGLISSIFIIILLFLFF